MSTFRIVVLVGVIAAILWQQWQWRSACRAAAVKILGELRTMYAGEQEIRETSPAEFPDVDKSGYERVREALAPLGFRYLGAAENVTVSRVFPAQRTFMDCSVNTADELTVFTYRLKQHHIVDCGTALGDGRYLLTTNAEADKLTPPPAVLKEALPAETPAAELHARHVRRLAELRRAGSAAANVPQTLDDALDIARRFSGLVTEYRRRIGLITEDEMLRLAPKQERTARRVFRELVKLRDGTARA